MGKFYAIVGALLCFCFASNSYASDADLSFGNAATFKIDSDQDINNEICNRPTICKTFYQNSATRSAYYEKVEKFTLSNPNEIASYVNGDGKIAFAPETLEKDCLKNKLVELRKQYKVMFVATSITARHCQSPQDVAHFSISYDVIQSGLMGQFGRLIYPNTQHVGIECALTTRNSPCFH